MSLIVLVDSTVFTDT